MQTSFRGSHRQTEVQSVDRHRTLPLIGEAKRPTTVQSTDGDWILACVRLALERTLQPKHAALAMEMDHSQMNRQLDGDGHLSVRRMGRLPAEFWAAFYEEIQAHYGHESDSQRLQKAEEAMQAALRVVFDLARKAAR